jgi:hypothetical protein
MFTARSAFPPGRSEPPSRADCSARGAPLLLRVPCPHIALCADSSWIAVRRENNILPEKCSLNKKNFHCGRIFQVACVLKKLPVFSWVSDGLHPCQLPLIIFAAIFYQPLIRVVATF